MKNHDYDMGGGSVEPTIPDITVGQIFLRRLGKNYFCLAERPFFRGTGALRFNLMCRIDVVVTGRTEA